MRAGNLRHRVAIEAASESQGTTGGQSVTWSSVATVWAAVEGIGGGERQDSGANTEIAQQQIRVTIRYNDAVDVSDGAKLRVKHLIRQGHTRYYDVTEVRDRPGRNHELQLFCTRDYV